MSWLKDFCKCVSYSSFSAKTPYLTVILLISIFGLSAASGAEEYPFGRIPFGANDSLEMLETTIAYNNFEFTVATNWVYNMLPEEKASFFSRRESSSPSFESIINYGPLENYLDSPPGETYFAWTNKKWAQLHWASP